MKRIALWAACLIMAASCAKPSAQFYVDWIYDNMPLADSVGCTREYWEQNVQKTLQTRRQMGWNIPEREFRHFVLPVRVNNETLDDFRTIYADTLCARVKGMTITEAALEINHWCHEQATYKPSDSRTSSPIATIRNGVGRCGEESVLAVAALRAAGIPARQVYTPRWAHTDDNHAWVEVWADGQWHFMGACEPEPRLNMAWFNAPVSRAMLLHTNVFGRYDGPEDVIGRSPVNTEINVIRGYVPARVTRIKVVDTTGQPVEGASVAFTIYNYAEFYEVARYTTNSLGETSLNTGCGDMLVFASHNGRFGFAVAGAEGPTEVVLSHTEGERFAADLTIVPPVENPIPSGATEEEIATNARRFAEEDTIRASHEHNNPDVEAFRANGGARAERLLSLLTAKDLCDVTYDVLQDALVVDSDDALVLSPRVEREALKPFRTDVLAAVKAGGATELEELAACGSPEDVSAWVNRWISVSDERSPRRLRIAPIDVWRSRKANSRSRDIFYVALCRALGFPARLDEVTGSVEASGPAGELLLSYAPVASVPTPKYYRHFTLSRWEDGKAHLLEFGSDADDTPLAALGTPAKGGATRVTLEQGYYSLTTGSRMADGSVLAHLEFFELGSSGASVPLVMRESSDEVQVLGTMDADRFLPLTGRGYYIVAVLGERDEPSVHARVDLCGMASELNAWGRPVVVLGAGDFSALSNAVSCTFDRTEIAGMLTTGCDINGYTLPVIAVCDSFGRIVYYSKGYNTSLPSDLRRIIGKL